MGQYPKIGVEFVQRLSQAHEVFFTVGLTIVGQQLVSMLVDRFGLLRLPQRPISGLRLASVALLLSGVGLILML